jgi:hypothetical protein
MSKGACGGQECGGSRTNASTLPANGLWGRSGHEFVSLPTTSSRQPNIFREVILSLKVSHFKEVSTRHGIILAEQKNRNASLDLRGDLAAFPLARLTAPARCFGSRRTQ